jgi:hypothetical protein
MRVAVAVVVALHKRPLAQAARAVGVLVQVVLLHQLSVLLIQVAVVAEEAIKQHQEKMA